MCATSVSDDPERLLNEHETAVYLALRGFRLFRYLDEDGMERQMPAYVIVRDVHTKSDWTYVRPPITIRSLARRCEVASPSYWKQVEDARETDRLVEVHL